MNRGTRTRIKPAKPQATSRRKTTISFGLKKKCGDRRAQYEVMLSMAEVTFYDSAEDALLKFAVIIARTDGKWIFCKHRERDTYEVPGGHREKGEDILSAAKRELMEETGAVDFTIKPICVYSVKGKTRASEGADDETFGMLFAAEVFSFEEIHSEIEKILITDRLVEHWTYPQIQPKLIEEAKNRGFL